MSVSVIRRKGVQFIRQARQAFDKEEDVRKFVPPKINFESNRFCDLVDLHSAEKNRTTSDQGPAR